MFQSSVPHYDTGGFKSHRKFLADKEYGEALDTLVKACSDMLLISPDGERIFLGKRNVQPQVRACFLTSRSHRSSRRARIALASSGFTVPCVCPAARLVVHWRPHLPW